MFIGHVELMKAVKCSVYSAAAVGRGVDHAGEVQGSVYQVVGGSLFNCVEVVPHIHYIAKSIGVLGHPPHLFGVQSLMFKHIMIF